MPSHDKLAPVRVERDTYARLRKAAEAGGHTITEEVRRRLAASFDRDDRDPALAKLLRWIGKLAFSLQADTDGPWHSDPFAFVAFRAGVLALLETMRPAGDPVPPEGLRLFSKDDNPETVGRVHARIVLRWQE
ncbi:MAG TPA: hypothetical protein VGU20_01145 [Stellaceae bacterium]|nr:hypothetical protein [Stellaceae bacterium]